MEVNFDIHHVVMSVRPSNTCLLEYLLMHVF